MGTFRVVGLRLNCDWRHIRATMESRTDSMMIGCGSLTTDASSEGGASCAGPLDSMDSAINSRGTGCMPTGMCRSVTVALADFLQAFRIGQAPLWESVLQAVGADGP